MPVFMVTRPNARSLSVSQGKGLDKVSAAVSGLMEAIESFHAEHVELPLKLASHRELLGQQSVVDVARLPRSKASNYHERRPMLWAEGLELYANEPMWVPYELVHTNFSLPLPQGSGAFLMSSNGLASGNTKLEALSHALCELVERDAMTLFSLSGGLGRADLRVRPETIDHEDCRTLLARFDAAGIAYGLWDVTSDIELPAFVCVIVDREPNSFRMLYGASGSGCHSARDVAMLRAVTEAAQCRLTYISGARDDGDRDFFERARNPDQVAELRSQILSPAPLGRSFAQAPTRTHETFLEDVSWELECLRGAGIHQAVAVDLTKPEFQLPVMRVIVPGLESLHNAPGFAPGARARAALSKRQS
jgi:ribosomal protein S12 methylthiotransferase accessory factor